MKIRRKTALNLPMDARSLSRWKNLHAPHCLPQRAFAADARPRQLNLLVVVRSNAYLVVKLQACKWDCRPAHHQPHEIGSTTGHRQTIQKSQPGGNFAIGPRDFHCGQKYHDHKSRHFYGGCIPRDWAGVLHHSILQPKTNRRAEEVERDRPAYIRIVSHC